MGIPLLIVCYILYLVPQTDQSCPVQRGVIMQASVQSHSPGCRLARPAMRDANRSPLWRKMSIIYHLLSIIHRPSAAIKVSDEIILGALESALEWAAVLHVDKVSYRPLERAQWMVAGTGGGQTLEESGIMRDNSR